MQHASREDLEKDGDAKAHSSLPVYRCLCTSAWVCLAGFVTAWPPLRWWWSWFNLEDRLILYECLWPGLYWKHKHAHQHSHTPDLNAWIEGPFKLAQKLFFNHTKDVSPGGLVFVHIYYPPFGIKFLPDLRCWFMNWKDLFILVEVWCLRGKTCSFDMTLGMSVVPSCSAWALCGCVWARLEGSV